MTKFITIRVTGPGWEIQCTGTRKWAEKIIKYCMEDTMFKLMVSFDAGLSYGPFAESNDCKELEERTKREDINWTRWYIEEDGRPIKEIVCPIHKNIFETFKKLNSA